MVVDEPGSVRRSGDDAADRAEEAAGTARDSKVFGALLGIGLVTYGVIHLMIAWIALRLAWGDSSASADQQGALQQLASTPVGPILLWIVAIGLFALVLWRIGLAIWGFSWYRAEMRVAKRVSSLAQAVVYGALGVSALGIATGGGSSSGGSSDSMSARLLAQPFGRALLGAVAAGIVIVGIYLVVKGIRKRFTQELVDGGGPILNRVGQIGFVAKGLAFVLIGALFGWAALSHDAAKAGGLDAALHTVRQQQYGAVLLTAFAFGLAAFGVFCFGWSRRARRS
jgi:hypothetical protein